MAVWAPTPGQVKALIPQRTNGKPFSPDTVPTLTDVQELIGQTIIDVVGEVGPFDHTTVINTTEVAAGDDPITMGDLAARAVALGVAHQIEDQFFPEQQVGPYGEVDTTAIRLYQRYRRAVDRLQAEIEEGQGRVAVGSIPSQLPAVRALRRGL